MDAIEAIREMMRTWGKGPSELSRRIGKGRTYVASTLSHGSTPRVDTMARLAHECGYRLILRRDSTGDEIELYTEEDAESRIRKQLPKDPKVGDALEALGDLGNAYDSDQTVMLTLQDGTGGLIRSVFPLGDDHLQSVRKLLADDPSMRVVDVQIMRGWHLPDSSESLIELAERQDREAGIGPPETHPTAPSPPAT